MNGNFVIDALAVYRLTRLVTRDTITEEIRETIKQELQTTAEAGIAPEKSIQKIVYFLECDWCMSVWVASAAYCMKKYIPETWSTISYVLAASAVAGALANQE